MFHDTRGQCCPEGAWGELNNADYQTLGQIDKVFFEKKNEKFLSIMRTTTAQSEKCKKFTVHFRNYS